MKRKRLIITGIIAVAAIALMLAVVGCGSDEEQEPTEATTTETTTEATTAAPKDDDILKSKLQAMIEEYGRGTSSGSGVIYAKTLDMDGDGKVEMVVIHDMTAEIFAARDGKAESIFQGKIGLQYGQTDTRYEVLINESITPPALILFNASDEWVDENITIVTMADGEVMEKNMRASTNGENDTPAREELVNFSIDGANVSPSDYENEYNRITEGADVISPMTPADLDEILAGM